MFLGIDLGTSGVKVLLIDADQSLVVSATAPLTVSRPHSGWSEQDPADWITATQSALKQVGAQQDLAAVQSIGLSGQMHGAVLLGRDDQVLRPCILWNDTRAHVEAAAMDADPQFRKLTGNIVFPGFTAPKLAWVRTHEPEVFAKTTTVLLPKDYLRLWLTGSRVSDMSDAAGTAWLDTGQRAWSDSLLAATGLDRSYMPDLVEGSAASGNLRGEVAQAFGLPANIPVAGGGGDNAASAVGVGVARAGEAFVSLGTSGVLFAATDVYAPAPQTALHSFCHALPGQWHQMGVILAASDALTWYGHLVDQDPAALTEALGPLQAPGRTLFLPYLGGERTPHNDAQIRGALIGLEHATDRACVTRAVLEGVAFALGDSLAAMQATGTELEQVIAVGGGARSGYWLQVLACVLDLPVAIPEDGDYGAAFGAARLAMMAAGQGGPELATPPSLKRVIEPDQALRDAFDTAKQRFNAAYPALKALS